MAALGLITQESKRSRGGEHRPDGAAAGRGELRRAGPVPRRVAALLAPPPQLPLLLLAAAIVLVTVSGASALEAAHDFHQLIELAQGPTG
jgi:hypothetical protein